MTVRLDYVEDATVRQDASGIEVTRRARITGIGGTSNAPRLALEAPGLPRFGARHPAWAQLRLANVVLTPIDVNTWDASLVYREPTTADLAASEPSGTVIDRQWFAVTVTEELNTDVNGERMYHWYTGNPLTPEITGASTVRFRPSIAKQFVWKNETAAVQRPSVGARVIVVEDQNIESKVFFSGTINAARWSGYAEQTWLVGGLDSRFERNRWVNTYELFYKPDTWRFRSVVEYFGAPPSDATEGNGEQTFDVYPQRNFTGLGFNL